MKSRKLSSAAFLATFSVVVTLLSTSSYAQDDLNYSQAGPRHHIRSLTIEDTKKSNSTKTTKCHICNRPSPKSSVISVDYLIVGAGPAGLSTAADLSQALRKIGSDKTIAVIEKESSHGGRLKSVDLVEPVGYNGPPLRADVGATRIQPSTLVNTRRLFNEYGVDAYCSIFNNRQVTRGRSKYCDEHNHCNIFGSFCVDVPIFVDETQTVEKPFGSAFAGIPDSTSAETDAVSYLYGFSKKNPVTGLRCDNNSPDQKYQCPEEACKVATDYKTFLANHLSSEYSELLKHANVGFFGDFESSINACRHREWLTREYDTLSYNCYPIGGMQTLPDKMVERCETNGNVDFYFDQPAMCVNSSGKKNYRYKVVTPDYKFKVREFLFLATSNTEFTEGKIGGDVIEDIASAPEAKSAKSVEVLTVFMQWDPDSPVWFMDMLDKSGGTYSLRAYGDLDCFSRIEIIDTPYHRQQNSMRVVYSDHQCKEMWKNLIEDAEQTGNTDMLRDRAMEGLVHLFPEHKIPQPVKTVGAFWSNGWHFTEPTSKVKTDDVIMFAANPFKDNNKYDNICLLGEAWQPLYGSWMESALLSSMNCFEYNFDGSMLGTALENIFDDRAEIVNTYSDNDPSFSAYPGETTSGQAFPILSNEYFPPFNCLYNSNNGSLLTALTKGDTCTGPKCSGQGVPM